MKRIAILLVAVAAVAGTVASSASAFRSMNTVRAEEHLTRGFHQETSATAADSQHALADEGRLPELAGAIGWLNSVPLNRKSLRGKVVLVDIWTYSCINSLRQLPYIMSWAAKYKDAGLVVIGVHAPEFGFEKERANVENAVRDLKLTYPVAIDSDHAIWQAAAIIALAKTFAEQGIKDGVKVNSVVPGAVMTGRRMSFFKKWAPAHNLSVEEAMRKFPEEVGISRFGKPEEIADLMAYLVSPAAKWMTGSCVRMDGGEIKGI
jgi:thiol-disulfide isomerase/thioredoxin